MNKRSLVLWVSVSCAVCAVLALSVGALAYQVYVAQASSPAVRAWAARLHLPAARVGSRFVGYADYLIQLDAEREFLAGPAARAQGLSLEVTSEVRERALMQAMRVAALEEAASARGIVITPLDVERAYDGLVVRAGTSTTPEEIRLFLRDQFGRDEARFKQYVIRPALIEDVLRQKRYQETQDPEAFDRELHERLARDDVKRYLQF